MKQPTILGLLAIATLAGCVTAPVEQTPTSAPPPNFVFILADDLGITDISAYARHFTGAGQDEPYYLTPNLDRLVQDGTAFEQAYVAPLCSPTRAGLLTGRLPQRMGFTTATPPTRTFYSGSVEPPAGSMPLDAIDHRDRIEIEQPFVNGKSLVALPAGHVLDNGADVTTIPEALPDYHSVFLGKWHLGGHGAPGHAPTDNGFDEAPAWYDAGGSLYFKWRRSWQRTEPFFDTDPSKALNLGTPGTPTREDYLTDDLTARAVAFIGSEQAEQGPFLLYLAHFAVHTPIQATEKATTQFMVRDQRGWKGHRYPEYAAMVEALDRSVGQIRAALEREGLADNTYIIFISDNGGVDWQVGPDVPAVRVAPGENYDGNPPPTSNTPFRGGKATLYEGGVRVPLIVWGPHSRGGGWQHQTVDMTDIFPTLYELAGHDPRPFYRDSTFDGRSFVSLLRADGNASATPYEKESIYWHYPFNVIVPDTSDGMASGPSSAMRHGRWKLIDFYRGEAQLFDVEADPFERNDLAASMPERTLAMRRELRRWLGANVPAQYFATPNPNYDPAKDLRGAARFDIPPPSAQGVQ